MKLILTLLLIFFSVFYLIEGLSGVGTIFTDLKYSDDSNAWSCPKLKVWEEVQYLLDRLTINLMAFVPCILAIANIVFKRNIGLFPVILFSAVSILTTILFERNIKGIRDFINEERKKAKKYTEFTDLDYSQYLRSKRDKRIFWYSIITSIVSVILVAFV